MNKFHSFLILFCSILCMTASVSAAEANTTIIEQTEMQEIFTDIMSTHVPDHVEEIHVTHFYSTPATITIPAGKISYRSIKKTSSFSPGKKFVTVVISVNNQEQGTVREKPEHHRSLTRPSIETRRRPVKGLIADGQRFRLRLGLSTAKVKNRLFERMKEGHCSMVLRAVHRRRRKSGRNTEPAKIARSNLDRVC